jgi:hypothetical protein
MTNHTSKPSPEIKPRHGTTAKPNEQTLDDVVLDKEAILAGTDVQAAKPAPRKKASGAPPPAGRRSTSSPRGSMQRRSSSNRPQRPRRGPRSSRSAT